MSDAAYALYGPYGQLTREDWGTAARYAALARANYPLMNTANIIADSILPIKNGYGVSTTAKKKHWEWQR